MGHLLLALVSTIIAQLCGVAYAPAPPLPFKDWTSWVVVTHTNLLPNGTAVEVASYGQNFDVSVNQSVACSYNGQVLFPQPNPIPNYLITECWNYSSHVESSQRVWNTGTSTNCTQSTLSGSMRSNGKWYLAPDAKVLRQMRFINYTTCNDKNSSIWVANVPLSPTVLRIFTWIVNVGDNYPCVYVNQTNYATTKTSTIYTAAFDGFGPLSYGVATACAASLMCGQDVCIARRSASEKTVQNALSWVCGQENCDYLSPGGANYFPNNTYSHADYAFNEYYQNNRWAGPSSCVFGGAAELVACNTACTTCNASSKATTTQLQDALTWVCSPQGFGNCTAIEQGGSNYLPNTLQSHADWAFNQYYQAYKCVPGVDACNFKGAGEIVPCE